MAATITADGSETPHHARRCKSRGRPPRNGVAHAEPADPPAGERAHRRGGRPRGPQARLFAEPDRAHAEDAQVVHDRRAHPRPHKPPVSAADPGHGRGVGRGRLHHAGGVDRRRSSPRAAAGRDAGGPPGRRLRDRDRRAPRSGCDRDDGGRPAGGAGQSHDPGKRRLRRGAGRPQGLDAGGRAPGRARPSPDRPPGGSRGDSRRDSCAGVASWRRWTSTGSR